MVDGWDTSRSARRRRAAAWARLGRDARAVYGAVVVESLPGYMRGALPDGDVERVAGELFVAGLLRLVTEDGERIGVEVHLDMRAFAGQFANDPARELFARWKEQQRGPRNVG